MGSHEEDELESWTEPIAKSSSRDLREAASYDRSCGTPSAHKRIIQIAQTWPLLQSSRSIQEEEEVQTRPEKQEAPVRSPQQNENSEKSSTHVQATTETTTLDQDLAAPVAPEQAMGMPSTESNDLEEETKEGEQATLDLQYDIPHMIAHDIMTGMNRIANKVTSAAPLFKGFSVMGVQKFQAASSGWNGLGFLYSQAPWSNNPKHSTSTALPTTASQRPAPSRVAFGCRETKQTVAPTTRSTAATRSKTRLLRSQF